MLVPSSARSGRTTAGGARSGSWLITVLHTRAQTQALARRLKIRFVWLLKEAPELDVMD